LLAMRPTADALAFSTVGRREPTQCGGDLLTWPKKWAKIPS